MESVTNLFYVVSILDHLNNGSIGGRATNPLFFQFFDQRTFVVSSRWRREFLKWGNIKRSGLIPFRQRGQRLFITSRWNARDSIETIECQHSPRCLQRSTGWLIATFKSYRGRIPLCICHLARNKAIIDQPIKLQLIRVQRLCNFLRCSSHLGRTNTLVSFLSIFIRRTIEFRLPRQISLPEFFANVFTDGIHCYRCNIR